MEKRRNELVLGLKPISQIVELFLHERIILGTVIDDADRVASA
jgi:hypothetical protein